MPSHPAQHSQVRDGPRKYQLVAGMGKSHLRRPIYQHVWSCSVLSCSLALETDPKDVEHHHPLVRWVETYQQDKVGFTSKHFPDSETKILERGWKLACWNSHLVRGTRLCWGPWVSSLNGIICGLYKLFGKLQQPCLQRRRNLEWDDWEDWPS